MIEGCPDCVAEGAFLESLGHQCGPSDLRDYSTLCEIEREARRNSEEFHRLSHEPIRCEDCGVVLNDHLGTTRERVRPCKAGWCNEWYCPDCGMTQSSSGPVECPSCGSFGSVTRRRIARMHRKYRAKRR